MDRGMTLIIAKGRGTFPIDMLRYDRCSPRTGQDSTKITHSVRYGGNSGPWEIELVTERRSVTVDRWASFGWQVTTA